MSWPFWIPDIQHVTEQSWWLAWCFSQVDTTKTLELHSSPPIITVARKFIQFCTMDTIRPDESSRWSASEDHALDTNSQLWWLLYWTSRLIEDLTHPYMEAQFSERERQEYVQNTHCTRHRNCRSIICMPPVRRNKHHVSDEPYTLCWCWVWETDWLARYMSLSFPDIHNEYNSEIAHLGHN